MLNAITVGQSFTASYTPNRDCNQPELDTVEICRVSWEVDVGLLFRYQGVNFGKTRVFPLQAVNMKLIAHPQKLPDTLAEGTIICLPHWMEALFSCKNCAQLVCCNSRPAWIASLSAFNFFTGKNIGKRVADQKEHKVKRPESLTQTPDSPGGRYYSTQTLGRDDPKVCFALYVELSLVDTRTLVPKLSLPGCIYPSLS